MSDAGTRRIRARASAADDSVMSFTLDAEIEPGRSARFDGPGKAPLARALFSVPGVIRAEVNGATIWVKKDASTGWAALKPAVARAIRHGLIGRDAPLGPTGTDSSAGRADDAALPGSTDGQAPAALDTPDAPAGRDDPDAPAGRDDPDAPAGRDNPDAPAGRDNPDAALLAAVRDLLDRQVNPAVAGHGGHIAVDRVAGTTVFLRMSGGCQGCAASAATLRQGVERMLRAALPRIGEIVDVTDHAAGDNPFYTRENGPSPALNRAIPDRVIGREDGQITVDPDFLAPRLGLTPETLREGLRNSDVVGITEAGTGAESGKTRIVLRSAHRAWAAEIDETGAAREIPPPRRIDAGSDNGAGPDEALVDRVRAELDALDGDAAPMTYGALARALRLWMPGSVGKVTRALEATMHQDAAAGRPFIAARAVGRGRDRLPGKGFFDLARALSRGPRDDETDRQFHQRELGRLDRASAGTEKTAAGG